MALSNWSQPLASALHPQLHPQLRPGWSEGGASHQLNSTAQLVLEGIHRVEEAIRAEQEHKAAGLDEYQLEDEERLLAEAELLEKLLASDTRQDSDVDYALDLGNSVLSHQHLDEHDGDVKVGEHHAAGHHQEFQEHGHHEHGNHSSGHTSHGGNGDKHGGGHHEIPSVSLASWKWHHVEAYIIVTLFIILSGLCKLVFHQLHWLSSRVPESCVLIIVGIIFGAILDEIDRCTPEDYCIDGRLLETFPEFTPTLFFYILLPPIILESAYSLHNRVFMGNLRTIILYAVFGTIFNFLLIGAFLILFYEIGWMGTETVFERRLIGSAPEPPLEGEGTVYSTMTPIQILLFASLISAVDPVAVLAIFSEVGVNPDLYFMVFGESLLNDGVAVVLYNMMIAFAGMEFKNEEITGTHIVTGVFSFFTIALGGLAIGLIIGLITGLVTRATSHVEVLQPLTVFCLAYLSYLVADVVGWSGIIALIGCGLLQAHYSFKNISENSIITIKYFIKVMSSTSDCIIFLYLGMAVIGEQVWHTGFVCWTLVLCLVIRILGTFLQTFVVNWLRNHINTINYQEQFIMSYGGLRGAVGFSLVKLIDKSIVPSAGLFVTTTLAVIMSTVFIQGGTIKSLVKLLDITLAENSSDSLMEEINTKLFDHIMSGVEIISGKHGHFYVNAWMDNFDNKYMKKWLCVPGYDRRFKKMYQEMTLTDHLTHLYGPALIIEETLEEAAYTNKSFNPEGEELRFSSPLKHRSGSVRSNRVLTAKDRDDLTNALRIDPVNKFHMVADKNIRHEDDLDIEKVLLRRRQSADKIRQIVMRKHEQDAMMQRSRAQSIATISADMLPRGAALYSSFKRPSSGLCSSAPGTPDLRSGLYNKPPRLYAIARLLQESLGEDRSAVETILHDHQDFRRRKSLYSECSETGSLPAMLETISEKESNSPEQTTPIPSTPTTAAKILSKELKRSDSTGKKKE